MRTPGGRVAFPLPPGVRGKAKDMILRKTREQISTVVAQPARNSMMLSILAVAIALVALMIAGISVNR